MKAGSRRWWKTNEDGTTTAIVTPPGVPDPQGWTRGFPPKGETEKIAHAERMRRIHKGIEKSSIQRQRMAMAKIGIPKSNTHRQNMRLSHKRRHLRILEIMRMYDISYNRASAHEAKLKNSDDKPDWFIRLLDETEELMFD